MARNPTSSALRLAAVAGALACTLVRAEAPAPATAASTARDFAEQVLAAVNDYRLRNQLPRLEPDDTLQALALEHSRDMSRSARLSHSGFQARFQRAHRRLCVENLAGGFRRADAVLDGWRASPTHLVNLLEPRVVRVGLAQVDGWVTLFACSTPVDYQVAAAR